MQVQTIWSAIFLSLLCLWSSPSSAQTITLYSGTNGKGSVVCKVSLPTNEGMEYNFKAGGNCKNDEASSALLEDIPENMSIYLFDSPEGSRRDDFVRIRALRRISRRLVGSFEKDVRNDPALSVVYRKRNGLKGKVSSLVSRPYRVPACKNPQIWLAASGIDPVNVTARARSTCKGVMQIRLRRHIPGQFDRNLKTERLRASSLDLNYKYECEKSSYGNTVFAELTYNGTKSYSRRLDLCDGFTTKPDRPAASGYSQATIYNCDRSGTAHGIWVLLPGGSWKKEGSVSSGWSGRGCASPGSKTVDLPTGSRIVLVTTNRTLSGCRTEDPLASQCQSSLTGPFRATRDGGTLFINVN